MSNIVSLSKVSARVAWHAARDEALAAYDAWCEAERGDKADAYVVYRAAADREDAAATALLLSAERGAGDLAAAA
jgi:hypothetical protein